MATVTKPILTDATGQDIVDKLDELVGAVRPTASDIPLTPPSGMTSTNVQDGFNEINQSLSDLGEKLVNTRLICNSSGYFPLNSGDTPPYNRGQITVITRNRNTGAIYALWYDNSVTGFRVGAVISGSNPSQGNTVDIQYLG